MNTKWRKKRSLLRGRRIGVYPGQYYDAETGLHYNYFRYYNPPIGRYLTPDPIGLKGGINLFAYTNNNPMTFADPKGLQVTEDPKQKTDDKDCDCPGGEWSSFSVPAFSAFWGGGGTIARTTYKCKTNNRVCKATSICFGGGAIGAVGIGIDFGGYPESTVGVENIYYISDFSEFSSGVYAAGGPVSITFTGASKNVGISKSWGAGVVYVTCFNIYITCK